MPPLTTSISRTPCTPAGAGLLLALFLACMPAEQTSRPGEVERPRVIVVGIDSLSWTWLDPLVAEGKLPHFAALRDRGYSAELETVEPVISPTNWTSIATGRSPQAHGVLSFFANRQQIRAPAAWERFSAAGLRTGVYDYLLTWPPRPLPGGFVIPSWLRRDDRTWPPDLQERFADEPIYTYRILDMGDLDATVAEVDRELDHKATDFLRLIDSFDTDVGFVNFYAVDVVSHRFYHTFEPAAFDPPIPYEPRYEGRILRTLERMDAAIGTLVSSLGPEDHLVLVSDHGSRASDPVFRTWGFAMDALLQRIFPELDLQGAAADGAASAASALRAGIVLETEAGDSVRVRAVNGFIEGVLAIGEGQALDEAAAERAAAAITERLADALGGVRTAGGEPVFRARIVDDPEAAMDDPRAAGLGPLGKNIIGPNLPAEAFAFVSVDPELADRLWPEGEILFEGERLRLGELIQSHAFTGDHHPTAFFLAAGPAIRPNIDQQRGSLSVLDIAPLLHYLAGLPIPDDLEGRSPESLIAPGYLEIHPIRTVAAERWPKNLLPDDASAFDGESTVIDETVSDEELQQRLRSLGYVR